MELTFSYDVRLATRDEIESDLADRRDRDGEEADRRIELLGERGFVPVWREARIGRVGEPDLDSIEGVVYIASDADPQAAANDEAESILNHFCSSLRDIDPIDVWPENVTARQVRIDSEVSARSLDGS